MIFLLFGNVVVLVVVMLICWYVLRGKMLLYCDFVFVWQCGCSYAGMCCINMDNQIFRFMVIILRAFF